MTCTACGGQMMPFLEARDYNRAASGEAFRYERCQHCGLISLVNVPTNLAMYYAAGYHEIPASAADLERGAEHDRYKIDLVREFVTHGRLLEIGPGWGAFCLLAKRAGFEVEAIEMDEQCCAFLRAQLGVRAIRSDDPVTALQQASRPNVIALWHVLEHVRDPLGLLEAACRKLAAGGVLIVATPNPESFQLRVFGRFWTHVDAPRHLHLLPASVLCKRAEKLGLEIGLVTMADSGSISWNDFGWRFSLANLSPLRILKRPLRVAGRVVSKLAGPIDRAKGLGSAYTAVFRSRTSP